ncbi:MAG TPA: YicC family protein [Rhodospirillaceae bacterium]|nr:YicC family protein [Rhodospirillaceae bacterium]
MTGFARTEGRNERFSWVVECKSLNARNLEIRCRMPQGFDDLEPSARTHIAERFRRGTVNLSVTLHPFASHKKLTINHDLLRQAVEALRSFHEDGAAPPRLDAILAIPGVIESQDDTLCEEARGDLCRILNEDIEKTLSSLLHIRQAEGGRLRDLMRGQLENMERLVEQADHAAVGLPEMLRARFESQLHEWMGAMPPLPADRIAQEVALLLVKSDIREEIDRLRTHIEAARELLASGGAMGRHLDFLCQEFNREANTLCSKSQDVELTRMGLSLKGIIDQFREQSQNIE